MVSGRQRPAGAEWAESTSPLLRGFSSQWGRGGCLPQPESPSNPAAQGLLCVFPSRAEQAGRDAFSWRDQDRKKEGEGEGCWVLGREAVEEETMCP